MCDFPVLGVHPCYKSLATILVDYTKHSLVISTKMEAVSLLFIPQGIFETRGCIPRIANDTSRLAGTFKVQLYGCVKKGETEGKPCCSFAL